MATLAQLVVRLVADAGKFKQELASSEKTVTGFTKKAGQGLKEFSASFRSSFQTGMFEQAGHMAANFVSQLPGMVVDLAKVGVESKTAHERLVAFAGGEQQAAEYMAALNAATDGTIPKIGGMGAATKLLQMKLVDSSQEMGTMAAIATKLGDQTISADQRMADWAATLANQSIPRLDNFGISSGRVRARIAELQSQFAGMSREEAFAKAVMEEGEKALALLGDTSQLTSTKVAKLEASVETAKTELGEWIVEVGEGTGALDWITGSLDIAGDTMRRWTMLAGAAYKGTQEFNNGPGGAANLVNVITNLDDAWAVFNGQLRASAISMAGVAQGQEEMRYAHIRGLEVQDKVIKIVDDTITKTQDSAASWNQYAAAIEESYKAMDQAAASSVAYNAEALQTRQFVVDQTMAFTEHYRSVAESAADYAAKREEIESSHQAALVEIGKAGQAKAVAIDVAAEQAKLQALKQRLDLAYLQQSEFTDKTKESTRVAKEMQIAQIQEQVAGQQQLLDDYYAGRLVAQGKNVTDMLTAEEAKYAEELRLLEENRAAQEAEQLRSLGKMVLQSFEAWAAMKGISAEKALEMRTAIMEEYGLIDSQTAMLVNNQVAAWEAWADGTGASTEAVASRLANLQEKIQRFKESLEAIPRIITVDIVERINRETGAREVEYGAGGPKIAEYAGGTRFHPGGLAFVGERGRELVNLPRGAQVFTAPQTQAMLAGMGGNQTTIQVEPHYYRGDEPTLSEELRMLAMTYRVA